MILRHLGQVLFLLAAAALVAVALSSCRPREAVSASPGAPAVLAETTVEAGRYLVEVGSCHDCHTPGFMENPDVPESEWLVGSPVGFRGPWGVTYPPNLRLVVRQYTEDLWVERLKTTGRPPMVWPAVNALSEADARAIYQYIRSLPEAGTPAPAFVPPGQEPTTPYVDFVPQHMERLAAP